MRVCVSRGGAGRREDRVRRDPTERRLKPCRSIADDVLWNWSQRQEVVARPTNPRRCSQNPEHSIHIHRGGGACSWILLTRKLCFELLLRRHRDDFRPLVEGCGCYCCVNHQRAYLHHLLVTNELLAGVLLMIHNTAHYHAFFRALREALANDKLDVLKRRVLGEGGGQTERNEWLINPTDRRIDPYSPRPPLRSLDSLKALPFCCRGVPPHASEVTLPEADAFNAGGWKDTI